MFPRKNFFPLLLYKLNQVERRRYPSVICGHRIVMLRNVYKMTVKESLLYGVRWPREGILEMGMVTWMRNSGRMNKKLHHVIRGS